MIPSNYKQALNKYWGTCAYHYLMSNDTAFKIAMQKQMIALTKKMREFK